MTRGIWLSQIVGSPTVPDTIPASGNRILYKWGTLQPSVGVFDWGYFDDQIQYCVSRGISICIEIQVAGPDADNPFTPQWLYDNGVPKVTIDGSDNTYPYYLNSAYNTYLQTMIDAVMTHMTEYDADTKRLLYSWFAVYGSTGDVVPYQGGLPTEEAYEITPEDWSGYLKTKYLALNAQLQSLFQDMRTMINQGNNNKYFVWVQQNIIKYDLKTGDFSHTWCCCGDLNYSSLMQGLPEDVLCQSEGANPLWNTDEWNESQTRCTFALAASALTANMRVLNIPAGLYTANGGLRYAYTFYNKYANVFANSNKGFCYLSDRIDWADTERFPEDGYGPVIDPAQLGAYTTAYNAIIAANYPAAQTSYEITRITITYGNDARIAVINAEFPDANYLPVDRSRNGDAYMNDYNVNSMKGNYCLNIEQYNPNQGGYGVYRVGGVTNNTGRYGKMLDGGRPEIWFAFGSSMTVSGESKTFSVTYIDDGTGIWSVNCMTNKGICEMAVVQNKNTGDELTVDVNIDAIQLGGLLENDMDISIKHLNGDNCIFTLLEILL